MNWRHYVIYAVLIGGAMSVLFVEYGLWAFLIIPGLLCGGGLAVLAIEWAERGGKK